MIDSMIRAYNYVFFEATDPRTNDWLLFGHPYKLVGIVLLYLWIVLKAGPEFMRNRPPMEIKRFIQIYNLVQVVLCGIWSVATVLDLYGPYGKYNFICTPLDFTDTPTTRFHLFLGYCYVWLKILDLLDTIFFVLRKKDSHITFLHVYHHALLVLMSGFGLRYLPGGTGAYMFVVNTCVHTLMYFYFFLTSLDSSYSRAWWKKYLTIIQIVQFVSIFLVYGLSFLDPECTYPKTATLFLLPHPIIFTYLFTKFYIKTYILSPKIKEKKNK